MSMPDANGPVWGYGKICPKCGQQKKLAEFPTYGVTSTCRACLVEFSELHKQTDADVKRHADQLFYAAKWRAKKTGVPFSITKAWVLEKIKAGRCDMTGMVFSLSSPIEDGSSKKYPTFLTPSLDRLVPSAGYTSENVRAVIWGYNIAKSTWRDEDVLQMARALVSKQRRKRGS